jgi:hypothetical protein
MTAAAYRSATTTNDPTYSVSASAWRASSASGGAPSAAASVPVITTEIATLARSGTTYSIAANRYCCTKARFAPMNTIEQQNSR